jgi:hypothetical protein
VALRAARSSGEKVTVWVRELPGTSVHGAPAVHGLPVTAKSPWSAPDSVK